VFPSCSSQSQVIFVEDGRITETGDFSDLMRAKGRFYTLMSTFVGEESDSEDDDAELEGQTETGAGAAAIVPSGVGIVLTSGKPSLTRMKSKKQRNRGLQTARKSSAGDQHHHKKKHDKMDDAAKKKAAEERRVASALMQAEERTKGGVPWSVYVYYVRHCGGWFLVTIAFALMCAQTTDSTWTTWSVKNAGTQGPKGIRGSYVAHFCCSFCC
jgi:hypothetical protein